VKRIYITHCSREKDAEFEVSGEKTTPDRLYTSPSLQRFIRYCNENHHYWAIFSDKYGVVFRDERIKWYSKPPDSVTEEEFEELVKSFITRLAGFDEIHFHHRPGETHPVFQRVVDRARAEGLNVVDLTTEEMEKGE
jgi:hypothetical protein